MTDTHRITERMVASTKISFNGIRYWITVRDTMKGAGLYHFQSTHNDKILNAKSLCFAEHITKYGFSNQLTPDHELEVDYEPEETVEERELRFNPPPTELDILNEEIKRINSERLTNK